MKKYLKKDGTLEKKAIDLISIIRSGKYVKLSNFYASRTTKYPSVLNSDLFIIISDKEVIEKEGFHSLTKSIVKINKENEYVDRTLKELEEQDIEKLIKKLRRYNNWRRGAEIPMPHPQEITEMIDEAIKVLKTTIKK